MARPRKSTLVLEASGAFVKNPQRRRSVDTEPVRSGRIGKPPACFDAEHIEAWKEVVGNLQAGVLKKSDRFTVEMAARLVVRMRRDVATPSEMNTLHSIMGKFGATPADRSRVSVPKSKAGGNAFEE